MARQRMLLITSVDLGADGIGSHFISEITSRLEQVSLDVETCEPFLSSITRRTPLRMNAAALPNGRLHAMRLELFRLLSLDRTVADIVKRVESNSVDRVWLTASSPELIWVGARLGGLVPSLHVTVWDPPEYLGQGLALTTSTTRGILEQFELLLRRSNSCSVVSEEMRNAFERKYDIHSTVIRHGLPQCAVRSYQVDSECLNIVFAGSLYAKREWNAFIAALRAAEWQVGGRTVRLHYIGRFPKRGAEKPAEVEYVGSLSPECTAKYLRSMDVGYVPYWFDPRYERTAALSFPGKMSSYTAAGLAIFHHGPRYSSVTTFLERYPYGVACNSLDTASISAALESLLSGLVDDRYGAERMRAFDEELSSDVAVARFRRFAEVC